MFDWLVRLFVSRSGAGDRPRRSESCEFKGKHALRGALDITYIDAKGDRTDRYIEAVSLEGRGGKLYLGGWCEMRNAFRSFRVDRIATLADGETGEIVDDIASWLIDRALRGGG